jgi:SAM-dependent methyltransferase
VARPGSAARTEETARRVRDAQRDRWTKGFADDLDYFGHTSPFARDASVRFRAAGVRDVVELGAGQGRDTLFLATEGLSLTALDWSPTGLGQIEAKAAAAGLSDRVRTQVADVREPLPLTDSSFDACYAHLLFNMALTTEELERLSTEVRRVLRPRGLLMYSARNTSDPHAREGIDRGGGMFEAGHGYIVHFFSRALVTRLAKGWQLVEVRDYTEYDLPIRYFGVTHRKQ